MAALQAHGAGPLGARRAVGEMDFGLETAALKRPAGSKDSRSGLVAHRAIGFALAQAGRPSQARTCTSGAAGTDGAGECPREA